MRPYRPTLQRVHYALLTLLIWVGVAVAPYQGMLGARSLSEAPLETSSAAHAHHTHAHHPAQDDAPADAQHGAHHEHHGLYCALCVVGAGVSALSAALTFTLVSRTLHSPQFAAPPRLRSFIHHRSRAPPAPLVTC